MPRQEPEAQITTVTAITASLGQRASRLLRLVLPAQLVDDRFDPWAGQPSASEVSPGPGYQAALAWQADELVAYLGGAVSRHRLQLDALVEPAQPAPAELIGPMIDALGHGIARSGAARLELWGRPAQPWHETVAAELGLTPNRALHQMRCPLPAPGEALATRGFHPDDLEAVLAVNNRAFAAHPDQGGQTATDWRSTMAEPWFVAEGLRVYERHGRVAGFCWTKIHHRAEPALGEIYVIGVDPDFHGQGLGAPMTAAGLHWLHDQGLATGMLYVEADNEPAIRTYHRLGFETVRTDRAWDRPIADLPAGIDASVEANAGAEAGAATDRAVAQRRGERR